MLTLTPRDPTGSISPLSPLRSPPGLRVFGAKVPASRLRDELNLLRLRVHRDAFYLQAPPLIHVLRRPKSMFKSSSLELAWPFSTCQMKTPFFAPFLRKGVWKFLPILPKVPSSGFGYPPEGVVLAFFHLWKPIPASCAHGLRPSKPFSFQRIETKFLSSLSDPALFSKTLTGFRPALHRFHPRWKAVLIMRPKGLVQGGGTAFLGVLDLSGFLF